MSSSQPAEPSLTGPTDASGRGLSFDVEEAGRYQRVGVLGQGGMGRVFLARDTRLERDVALKEVLHEAPDTAARLVREALLTAQLDHPGIVPVYDAGRTAEGRLFYTMRLVRGRRLGDLVREASDVHARLRLVSHVRDVARALAFAHERNVVHRDVKPDNVLIGSLGETQLSDWGLARRVDGARFDDAASFSLADAELTRLGGSLVGTTRYAPPELARGTPATLRSDVYSLGALLLEVVTGHAPWAGLNHDDVVARLKAGDAAPVTLPPQTPPALRTLIVRALSADPSARAASASELANDLSALLDGRLVAAHSYSARELFTHFVRTWRVPLLAAGGVLAVALVALTAAGVVARRERDRALDAERSAEVRAAALLVQRARDLDSVGAVAEMQHLAAQAASLDPENVDALGVLVATGGVNGPRLLSVDASQPCRIARRVAEGTLCLDDGALTLWGAAGPRWRVALAATQLAVDESGVEALALVGGEAFRVSVATGAVTSLGPAPRYAVGLGVDPRVGAWVYNPGLLRLTWLGLTREVVPCAPLTELLGAIADEGALELLCSDGAVLRVTPWQVMSAAMRPLRLQLSGVPELHASRLVSAALLGGATTYVRVGPQTRLLGNVRGAVLRVHLDTGVVSHLSMRSHLGAVRQLLRSPDGVLVVGERGGPELLSASDGSLQASLPDWARGTAWEEAGALWLHGRRLSQWRLRDVGPGRWSAPVGLSTVSVSDDGRAVAVGGADGFIANWSPQNGATAVRSIGVTQAVKGVSLSGDGAEMLVGAVGMPGVALLVDEATTRVPALPAMRRVGRLADGTPWALGYELGPYFLVGGQLDEQRVEARPWIDGSTTASGDGVVLLDADGHAFVATRAELRPLGDRPGASSVVGSSTAGPFFFAKDSTVETSGGARLEVEGFVTALALSPDASWLAVGTSQGALLIYDAASLRPIARASLHRDRVSGIAFSRAGTLVTVGWDRQVRNWSLAPLDRLPAPEEVAARWGFVP